MWYFIPNHIFQKVGGLDFLLKCNYLPDKLPIKLSKFHQQALLAWKLSFVHNFSPHKALLWNNSEITAKGKSLFLLKWHRKGISHVVQLFDGSGTLLSYGQFITVNDFPILPKEFKSVICAIPSGLSQLIKNHFSYETVELRYPF